MTQKEINRLNELVTMPVRSQSEREELERLLLLSQIDQETNRNYP